MFKGPKYQLVTHTHTHTLWTTPKDTHAYMLSGPLIPHAAFDHDIARLKMEKR